MRKKCKPYSGNDILYVTLKFIASKIVDKIIK